MTMILFLELLFQKLLFKSRFENQKKMMYHMFKL